MPKLQTVILPLSEFIRVIIALAGDSENVSPTKV
jgi:hypothetical protein